MDPIRFRKKRYGYSIIHHKNRLKTPSEVPKPPGRLQEFPIGSPLIPPLDAVGAAADGCLRDLNGIPTGQNQPVNDAVESTIAKGDLVQANRLETVKRRIPCLNGQN